MTENDATLLERAVGADGSLAGLLKALGWIVILLAIVAAFVVFDRGGILIAGAFVIGGLAQGGLLLGVASIMTAVTRKRE